MTPAQADLARKLVALPGWEWPDGAAFLTGVIVYPLGSPLPVGTRLRIDGDAEDHHAEGRLRHALPDLTDDATAGVLLGMLAATGRLGPVTPMYSEVGGILYWRVTVYASFAGGNVRPASETIEADTLGEAVAGALLSVGMCR